MAEQIREVRELGVQVVVVIGGGNIFRGLPGSERGIERATGDYMGMLATVINALALQDALEKLGVRHARAKRHHHGAGGRAVHPPARGAAPGKGPGGHLRRRHGQSLFLHRHRGGAARERNRRGGDSQGHQGGRHLRQRSEEESRRPSAFAQITYLEALQKQLKVMDSTAFSLCMDNKMPIIVFDLFRPHNLEARGHGREGRHAGDR